MLLAVRSVWRGMRGWSFTSMERGGRAPSSGRRAGCQSFRSVFWSWLLSYEGFSGLWYVCTVCLCVRVLFIYFIPLVLLNNMCIRVWPPRSEIQTLKGACKKKKARENEKQDVQQIENGQSEIGLCLHSGVLCGLFFTNVGSLQWLQARFVTDYLPLVQLLLELNSLPEGYFINLLFLSVIIQLTVLSEGSKAWSFVEKVKIVN